MKCRVSREVTDHNAYVGMQSPMTRDDLRGKLTADRCGSEDAGVEMKKLHGKDLEELIKKSSHVGFASGRGIVSLTAMLGRRPASEKTVY